MIKHDNYNKFVQAIKLVNPYEHTFLKIICGKYVNAGSEIEYFMLFFSIIQCFRIYFKKGTLKQ